MNRTGMSRTLAGAAAACVSAVALFANVPAHGAQVTIDVPCAGSWVWNAGTSTLSCGATTGLACNPTANPTSPLPSNGVTIAANCTGATTWAWTADGANNAACPAVISGGANQLDLAAPNVVTPACVYRVAATDFPGSNTANGSKSVTWTNVIPPKPTNCTLTASPSPVSTTSGPVSLTMTCTGGGAATRYDWSASPNATFSGGTSTGTSNNSATISAMTTFTVTASNAGGVTAAEAIVQTGGGTGISCAAQGFSKTLVYNWNWASFPDKVDTLDLGSLGTNGILVVPFTATAPADVNNVTPISVTGYPGTLTYSPRIRMAISTVPCDLDGVPGGGTTGIYQDSPTLSYGVGTVPTIFGSPTAAALTPKTLTTSGQYYLNVAFRGPKVKPFTTKTCTGPASCDARISFTVPAGH